MQKVVYGWLTDIYRNYPTITTPFNYLTTAKGKIMNINDAIDSLFVSTRIGRNILTGASIDNFTHIVRDLSNGDTAYGQLLLYYLTHFIYFLSNTS
jgi:hypothetical protein